MITGTGAPFLLETEWNISVFSRYTIKIEEKYDIRKCEKKRIILKMWTLNLTKKSFQYLMNFLTSFLPTNMAHHLDNNFN